MKKSIVNTISLCLFLLLSSCGEDDESCASNGQVNGECFNAVLNGYNVQSINQSNTSFTRENIFIAYQFEGTRAERYEIRARANQFDGQDFRENGVNYRFEEGREYNEGMMTFNRNINAPASGTLTVTFSKIDRENGLVSGSFVWTSASTGETTNNLSGNFSDVEVALDPV